MKVMVVAEIASNWDGSIAKAKKIIKECKKAGADAVKFQMWRASDLYNSKHPQSEKYKKNSQSKIDPGICGNKVANICISRLPGHIADSPRKEAHKEANQNEGS